MSLIWSATLDYVLKLYSTSAFGLTPVTWIKFAAFNLINIELCSISILSLVFHRKISVKSMPFKILMIAVMMQVRWLNLLS